MKRLAQVGATAPLHLSSMRA